MIEVESHQTDNIYPISGTASGSHDVVNGLFRYGNIYRNTSNGFAVEIRKQMVALNESGYNTNEIAKALNCSISVVKKWLKRYREGGFDALVDLSRAPVHREYKNTPETKEIVKQIMKEFPYFGSRRIAHKIEKRYRINIHYTTVLGIMKELNPKKPTVICEEIEVEGVDEIWHMDMMYMRIAKGKKQYVFGIVDACTRRVMAIANYDRLATTSAIDCLEKAIEYNGGKAPETLYTDNGRMFISKSFKRFCGKIRVNHHLTKKHSPWENGKIERLFGTLRREWIAYRRYITCKSFRDSLYEFQRYYNNDREIQKLGYKTPMQIRENKTIKSY